MTLHAPYGGVVPELAARDHLHAVSPVVEAALARSGKSLAEIGGIAVTARPRLSGALLVGVQVAQGLAWATDRPLAGVDRLVGHLLAVFLRHPGIEEPPPPSLPFVALLASGGYTAIYRVDGLELSSITELGATRDDAAGEAFDKIAKLLALGCPGGPIIDRLAREGDPRAIPLAQPMSSRATLEFSFSGMKSDVVRWVSLQVERLGVHDRTPAHQEAQDAEQFDDHGASWPTSPKPPRPMTLATGFDANSV